MATDNKIPQQKTSIFQYFRVIIRSPWYLPAAILRSMPGNAVEQLYCSEQIHIPATFPWIMKLYCKAAIKTQPYDLLKWSASYFRALANGEEPPVKERMEYPPYETPTGLTPGYLKVLIKQIGKDPDTQITAEVVLARWDAVCLQEEGLVKILAVMGARSTFNWLQFVAVAASTLTNTLTQTMIMLCDLLTPEPEGGSASIPVQIFKQLYTYLADMDCGPLTAEEQQSTLDEDDIETIARRIRLGDYEELAEEVKESTNDVTDNREVQEPETDMEAANSVQNAETEQTDDDIEGGARSAESVERSVKEDEESGGDEEEKKSSRTEMEVLGEETEEERGEGEEEEGEKEGGQNRKVPEEEGEDQGLEETKGEDSMAELSGEVTEPEPTVKEESEVGEDNQSVRTSMFGENDGTSSEPLEKLDPESDDKLVSQQLDELINQEGEDISELGDHVDENGSQLLYPDSQTAGFKLFKKRLCQDIPGIGPQIGKEQVEKVLDFMDYWAQRQGMMVMPRNIRHWMCPPLDKVSYSD